MTEQQVPQDVDSGGSDGETGDELYIDNNEAEVDEEYDSDGFQVSGKTAQPKQNGAKGTKRPAPKIREPKTPRTPRRSSKRAKVINTPPSSSTEPGRPSPSTISAHNAVLQRNRAHLQSPSSTQLAGTRELCTSPATAGPPSASQPTQAARSEEAAWQAADPTPNTAATFNGEPGAN